MLIVSEYSVSLWHPLSHEVLCGFSDVFNNTMYMMLLGWQYQGLGKIRLGGGQSKVSATEGGQCHLVGTGLHLRSLQKKKSWKQ